MTKARKAAPRLTLKAITFASFAWCGFAIALPANAQPAPLSEQGLGRLFHTPQKRAVLDELRRRNTHIGSEQESDTIALQGIVRRSSGLSTVWINGQAHNERAPVAALGQSSARVFVGNGKTVEMKVGEQVRLDGGVQSEAKP